MRAYVVRSFGPPDALAPVDTAMPVPAAGEVLVRVRATSVNPYDWHYLRGQPYFARLGGLGLRRPKLQILGADLAGTVAAVGTGVTRFRPGDEVFGMAGQGAFAEYACVPEGGLAQKPERLSFPEAAAVPLAALTALLALRDVGRLHPGQRVLINGASGGVGTFAVQLARALGAGQVTGVCRTGNLDLVRSIGATDVIDYTTTDFTRSGQRYDLLVDIAGSRSALACRRVLTRKGSYVVVGGRAGRWLQPAGHGFAALALAPFVSQRMVMALLRPTGNERDLMTLAGLIEDGRVTPVIDRTYRFDEIPAAVGYQEQGHAPGKVVVSL
jgi:NADPH:quinone reductase-like Zn-dependent oxidoreductase